MREMDLSHPSIRIHLCGEFMVERLQPSSPSAPTTPTAPRYERVPHEEWRSRGPAIALLKVLVCHPRRRASRDTLIELLWPSVEDGASGHAFDSAVSILRKVLRTAQGESPLTKARSGGVTFYALPHQHYVWVDADAFEQTIDQAMKAERRGEDPLPLWEAAYGVGTGEFLEDERFSSWAQARRHRLNAARHRCVHRLVELYLARNMTDQAETLLQEVVMDNPTDEDALCRLLHLLQEQGRYQEALQLYHQAVSVLDEEYQIRPSARTTAIAERLRHGPMGIEPGQRAALVVPTFPTPALTPLLETRTSSRRQMLQEMLGVAAAALLTPPHELLNPDAWERLSKAISRPTYIDEAVLADLATITKSYWRLRANTSSSDLLNGVLGHFQTTVQMLRTVPVPPTADRLCSLAGEMAQLIGQMLFDMQDYATSWTYYKFSLNAAEEATNEVLRTVGLARLSLLLAASGQYQRSVLHLQKAQQGAARQARIRCWLAVVEAEVQAQLHNVDDCLQALDLAQQIATQQTFEEDSYATGLNLASVASYKGTCLVHLQRPDEALVTLHEAETLLDPLAIRRQSRLLTERATAHVQRQEIEEACRLAHQALAMTMQTKSMSVLQRIRRLREQLNAWETLPVVKNVDEHITTTFAVITS